jgi:hypothetical protein
VILKVLLALTQHMLKVKEICQFYKAEYKAITFGDIEEKYGEISFYISALGSATTSRSKHWRNYSHG